MNLAEEFVSNVCKSTFLGLWGFPNPYGKKAKELCDFLVVSDPYIIIFSVKHVQQRNGLEEEVDEARWRSYAIDGSVKQLYGAERYIHSVDKIILKDKKTEVLLPEKSKRVLFRIAVAIGRGDKRSLTQGDFGKGIVHVMDERSFALLLTELDTIVDFVKYISAKETYIKNKVIQFSNEENLLGYYLYNARSFPESGLIVGIILTLGAFHLLK